MKPTTTTPADYPFAYEAIDCSRPPFAQPEPFVDADAVAAFLRVERRQVLEMARKQIIPAHPLRGQGKGVRNTWRFRLSEVAAAIAGGVCKPVQPERRKGTPWRHKSR